MIVSELVQLLSNFNPDTEVVIEYEGVHDDIGRIYLWESTYPPSRVALVIQEDCLDKNLTPG